MFRVLLASTVCFFASWGVAVGQMPSEAEMRQQMEAAGMTPAQVEEALKSIASFTPPPEANVSAGLSTKVAAPADCVDENDNGVCDDEEGDPQTRQCLKTYVNIVEQYAQQLYGNELGGSALRVAQTCSTAVAGGASYYGYPGGPTAVGEGDRAWYTDMEKVVSIGAYWNEVIGYGRYIYGLASDIPEFDPDNLDEARVDAIVSTFPPALRSMLTLGQGDNMQEVAGPIHAKCEEIRRRVGLSYRSSVRGQTICLKFAPETSADENAEGAK